VTVIAFPAAETRERRLRGIEDCLDQLRDEALLLGLPLTAHLLGAAREATREARLGREARLDREADPPA
jgi:hypothetical protein